MEITLRNGLIMIVISIIIICIGIIWVANFSLTINAYTLILLIAGIIFLCGIGFIAFDKHYRKRPHNEKIAFIIELLIIIIIFIFFVLFRYWE